MDIFFAIGMRTKTPTDGLVVNTCSGNDTSQLGDVNHWTWSNPTNRRFIVSHPNDPDCRAVSVEALWQGTKLTGQSYPDAEIMRGAWRKNKGRRPMGAWDGPGRPLLTSPGAARRAIYLPAYREQIDHWRADSAVEMMIEYARKVGKCYLRDFDTGQGVDRNGPMSHAWALSVYLNTGKMPA